MKQDMLDTYSVKDISFYLDGNPYAGRGIAAGTSPGGKLVSCYFIMGRSSNSRNRVFVKDGDDLMIKPFDESKVEDPSLIIYYPLRTDGKHLVVTNGDQTDTIIEHLSKGSTFEGALREREFEPDEPNYTPRISSIFDLSNGNYTLSILKAGDPEGKTCSRYFFEYEPLPGLGRFIHTYETDGSPIPTFIGEPERINIKYDIDEMTDEIWTSLDPDNKISLYVRYLDAGTGNYEDRLINKYE